MIFCLLPYEFVWELTECAVPENIHTHPTEGFFALHPPPPRKFQFRLHTLVLKFWLARPPSPGNFWWPSMGWVWIFSGTVQCGFVKVIVCRAGRLQEHLLREFPLYHLWFASDQCFSSFSSIITPTVQTFCTWNYLVIKITCFFFFFKSKRQREGGKDSCPVCWVNWIL